MGRNYLKIVIFGLVWFGSGSTGDWTQGLMLAREALCQLNPFAFSLFFIWWFMILPGSSLACNPSIAASWVAGITGVLDHSWLNIPFYNYKIFYVSLIVTRKRNSVLDVQMLKKEAKIGSKTIVEHLPTICEALGSISSTTKI
jgi:hypothetical protein